MIELDDLRTVLKDPDHAEDEYIRALETAAVAYVEKQTGKYFGTAADATEVVSGTGTADLWLPGPVASVTSVAERAFAGDDDTAVAAADDDGYVVRGDRLVRKGGGVWARGYEYEVAYSRGAEAAPADIQEAVRKLVVLWFSRRLPVSDVQVSELPHGIADTLAAHRTPLV